MSGLPVPGLARRGGLRVSALRGARLAVARLAVARLGIARLAAEAQARQAWLRLVRFRAVRLTLKFLSRKSRLLRYGPGGVRSLGAGPLITRGRDYPGAFRCGWLILAPRGGRLVTSGPVRLVLSRDG